MSAGDPEIVDVINRRMALLEALAEPREKRELVEVLDCSRSTVDRALRELEPLGVVTREDGYRLTVIGRLVVEMFRDFQADLADVVAAEELLGVVPPDAPVDPALLRGSTVLEAGPPTPTRPLEAVVDVLERADHLRGLSVATTRPETFVDVYERLILEEGVPSTHVFTPAMAEFLRSTYRETIRAMMTDGEFRMYVTSELPYGMGLARTPDGPRVFVALYGDDGEFRGVILNDTLEAYAWAEGVFEHYRELAEELPPPEGVAAED